MVNIIAEIILIAIASFVITFAIFVVWKNFWIGFKNLIIKPKQHNYIRLYRKII